MNHLSEEQLILHYYGEADGSEHLGTCDACRAELRRLSATLDGFHSLEVPERLGGYETLVWQKLAPELRARKVTWWKRPLILAPLLTGLVVAAFFAGRVSNQHQRRTLLASTAISEEGRQRIFLVALGDHLERSQMVLVEIANSKPEDAADFQLSQQRARDLVSENRLYCQTAAQAGDHEFNGLLEDLGRVLTDIANGPSDLSTSELGALQRRIESCGLIFKIRVVGNNLQLKGSKQL